MYSDSDQVRIGNSTYTLGSPGVNNEYEPFMYKLSPSGELLWSKYFPTTNAISVFSNYYFFDPITDNLIVFFEMNPGSFTVGSTTITNSSSVSRVVIAVFDQHGNLLNHYFFSLSGGTQSSESMDNLTWFTNFNSGYSQFTFNYYINGTNLSFNPDFTGQTSSLETITSSSNYQLDYQLRVFNHFIDSSAKVTASDRCTLSPPEGKSPWLFGAIPTGRTSIKLFVSPGDGPFNSYTFRYGLNRNEMIYGWADVPFAGAWTYDINYLKPGTSYTFQVRSGNGCAVGPWSHEVTAKTFK